jgi:NADH-quinone oxidoreductase subunit N
VNTVNALLNAFYLIVPEGVLVLAACLMFVGGTFRSSRHLWGVLALVALAGAGLALALVPTPSADDPGMLFAAPLRADPLAQLVRVFALVGGAVLVLLSWDELPDRWAAEYHACLLVIVAGLCLTGSANELIVLFLALEMTSIPTYIILYLPRSDNAAREAAMKYFLLSVFSSALLLFGFSYLYGLTGTTNLPGMAEAFLRAVAVEGGKLPAVTQVALVMVVAGLCFRISAVPFHFYAPDVYQGTATAVAGLLAWVPKVAGFVALFRVLGFVLPEVFLTQADTRNSLAARPGLLLGLSVPMLMWILAAVTMTLGNVLALLQDNVKRILAYSSVAHAGYMLIALAVAPNLPRGSVGGIDAVLFYLVAYGAMTVGAFAVLSYLSTPRRPVETVDDLAGLSRSHPGVALLMALFLFSLTGIPLTAGFCGKLFLFWGAVTAGTDGALGEQAALFRILALVAALNAAIGGYYYLRIIAVMYLRDSLKPLERVRRWPGLATLWACAALTLWFGVYPKPLVELAQQAVMRPADRSAERAER